MEYSAEERRELLALARRTIEEYVNHGRRNYLSSENPKFQEKRGVFVTLHHRGELRGCIGYPLPYKPLSEGVVDNAIAAACEDPRFPPVTAKEIPELEIEISILTLPAAADDYRQVQVGRDGIIISKGFRRGLLLPQVPVEQGWNLEQYISYGCLKAGLAQDEWRQGVKIETFQAEVFGEKKSSAG